MSQPIKKSEGSYCCHNVVLRNKSHTQKGKEFCLQLAWPAKQKCAKSLTSMMDYKRSINKSQAVFFLNTPTIFNTHVELVVGSTTVTVLSWLTQASLFPLAEKQTLWTHPPLPAPPNSAITCPKGILDPHGVGAGFSSTSLMYAENTLRNKHANMIQNANKTFIFDIYIEG